MSSYDTLFVPKTTTITAGWLQTINDWLWKGRNALYTTSTNVGDAYTVTLPSPSKYAGLAAGDQFTWKVSATNTGPATLTIVSTGSLGAKNIYVRGTIALGAGDLLVDSIVTTVYDGTQFQLMTTVASGVLGPASATDGSLAKYDGITGKLLKDGAVIGADVQAYSSVLAALAAGGGDNSINDFRLTLTTAVPVTTVDVTGATTIYCTPYKGNRIALYSGSTWGLYSSAEFSLALGTLTATLPYDVFCYANSGVPTLEFTAWSNTTTRATALAYQDGVLSKAGALTRRYLGTFYTSSTTQTADAVATRYLENYYNQVDRLLSGTLSTDRTVTSSSLVEVNAEIQIKYVAGVVQTPIKFRVCGSSYVAAAATSVAIGIDSTDTQAATLGYVTAASFSNSISIVGEALPAIGYHYATLLGATQNGNSVVFYAANSVASYTQKVYLTATKKG